MLFLFCSASLHESPSRFDTTQFQDFTGDSLMTETALRLSACRKISLTCTGANFYEAQARSRELAGGRIIHQKTPKKNRQHNIIATKTLLDNTVVNSPT
jgi:hypothetical protein